MRGQEEVWAQRLELGEKQAGSGPEGAGGGSNSPQADLTGTGGKTEQPYCWPGGGVQVLGGCSSRGV